MKPSLPPLVLAAAFAVAVGTAAAHPGALPGVSDEQRDQIREILRRHRAEGLGDAIDRARESRRELRGVLRDPSSSETAVREAWRRSAVAREEVLVLRRKARVEALSVLTPEQREELKSRSWRVRGGRRRLL